MKIRAQRSALADTLAWVAQPIAKSPAQPALGGIRLTAANDRLTARSFDWDVSHSAQLDVDVVTDGECLVSGRFLAWVVGAIKGKEVELVLDGDELTISSGRSTYRARALRIEDYPALPAQPTKVGTVEASILSSAIAHARLFIDNDAPLPVLQGLHLEGDATELTAVGLRSAGANIAVADWQCAKPFVANPLPATLDSAVRGMAGEITIGFDGGVLGLADARRAVTMRTIEGEYAKWRVLIRPTDADTFEVVVERDDLVEALKRAGALCDDETPLAITFGAGEIEVAIAAGERGGGADLVVAECTGEHAMGMHARFLLAGITAMPAGPIRIGVGHREKGFRQPLVVRPLDSSDRVSLVMSKDLPGGTR